MKKLLLLCSSLLAAQLCGAQNPLFNLDNRPVAAMDYCPGVDQYALTGTIQTNPLAGFPNTNPHIYLNIFNSATNTVVLSKTYVTNTELMLLPDCHTLGAYFRVRDVRKTSDGGYIICGNVQRDPEVSHCNVGPNYIDPFILKVNAGGGVMWYKRYDNGSATDDLGMFNSIIENEHHTGYLVCGNRGNDAFVMGINTAGNPMWSHYITAYQYDNYPQQLPSAFTRICRYEDPNTNQVYYALTGSAGAEINIAHVLSYGGGLLTVVDENGAVFTNVQVSNDNNIEFTQFSGITDAFDGDVVITGYTAASIGGGTCTIGTDFHGNTVTAPYNTYDILNFKVNPLTLSQTFMKVYETGLGNCRGGNVTIGSAGGNISVIGGNYPLTASSEGVYLETDINGSITPGRLTPLGTSYTTTGSSILYSSKGYAVYGGAYFSTSLSGYLIKNTKGKDACATNYSPTISDPSPVIVDNTFQDDNIYETVDIMIDYNFTEPQSLICGTTKKETSSVVNVTAGSGLAVYPNPAKEYVDVQLPLGFTSGTISILDMQGRVVWSGEYTNSATPVRINTTSLTPGMYSIDAKCKQEVIHAKLAIQ